MKQERRVNDGEKARTECARALNEAIRAVVTEDANDRRLQRQQRKREKHHLVEEWEQQREGKGGERDVMLIKEFHALLSGSSYDPCTLESLTVLPCDPLCVKRLSMPDKERAEDLLSRMHSPLHTSIRRCVVKACMCWKSVRQPHNPCSCPLLHASRPVTELP